MDSIKTFDLDTFDTIGTVFTCIFIQGLIVLMINDILVCIIPNTIACGHEKGMEVDGGVMGGAMGGAMDCIVLTVAIFEAVIGQVVWNLNLFSDWV